VLKINWIYECDARGDSSPNHSVRERPVSALLAGMGILPTGWITIDSFVICDKHGVLIDDKPMVGIRYKGKKL